MKKLLLKEYNLSINKFFIYSPFLFASLLIIPNWLYIFAFMYVFWLIVPGVYSEYNVQNDITFTQLLPVSKGEIVKSKIYAFVYIELLHVLVAVVFALINNALYGIEKIFFDLNFAFFGNILIMYAIYNIIFLPIYFKTAFFFGKATLIGTLAATFYVIGIELLNLFVLPVNQILESPNLIIQIGILLFGILFYAFTLIYSIKKSIINFENRK